MTMKRSRSLYSVLSILFFCVLLLVDHVFSIIYQNNISIPYSLNKTSVLLKVEQQGTYPGDPDKFLECIKDADKVIAYDPQIRDVLYFSEADGQPWAWVRPSSPYEFLKKNGTVTLFGKTLNYIECPIPLAYVETDVIVPLYFKHSVSGNYYIQASDEKIVQSAEKVLSDAGFRYTIEPLAKDLKGTIRELLSYKEGYTAILVFFFTSLSFLTYTKLVMENTFEELYINRVFGAGRTDLLAARLKNRKPVYLACFIVSIVALIPGVSVLACIIALVMFFIIDCACICVSIKSSCRKMEVL